MILPVAVCVCMCVCVAVCYSVSQYTPLMYLQCHVIWLVDSFRDRHRVDNNEDCKDELKDLFGGGTIDGRHGRWSAVCLYTSLLHSCASVCECVRVCGYEGRRRPASMCRQSRTSAIRASEKTGCDARTAGGVACVPSRTLAIAVWVVVTMGRKGECENERLAPETGRRDGNERERARDAGAAVDPR